MGRQPGLIHLDTHVWYWWSVESKRLSENHRVATESAFADKQRVCVSVFSCWEMGMLVSKGKMELDRSVEDWADESLEAVGIGVVSLTREIAPLRLRAAR